MPPKKQDNKATVHLVIQRYRSCKILLDEREWRAVGGSSGGSTTTKATTDDDGKNRDGNHCGWLVYTSFASGCNPESIQKAVLTLFQMPLGTWGHWQERVVVASTGSGGRPQSLASMMEQLSLHHHQEQPQTDATTAGTTTNDSNPRLSVVLCPQANLVSKVKQNGKSVQYHGQCDKSLGEQLFVYFGLSLQALLLERQCELRQEPLPESLQTWKRLDSLDAALSHDSSSSWAWQSSLDMVTVVMGSFGKRQGLEFSSDMGPFCHTVQL